MLIILSSMWLVAYSSLVVKAVNFWAHSAMPVVVTTFAVTVLLWVGSCPTQLLFYTQPGRI